MRSETAKNWDGDDIVNRFLKFHNFCFMDWQGKSNEHAGMSVWLVVVGIKRCQEKILDTSFDLLYDSLCYGKDFGENAFIRFLWGTADRTSTGGLSGCGV